MFQHGQKGCVDWIVEINPHQTQGVLGTRLSAQIPKEGPRSPLLGVGATPAGWSCTKAQGSQQGLSRQHVRTARAAVGCLFERFTQHRPVKHNKQNYYWVVHMRTAQVPQHGASMCLDSTDLYFRPNSLHGYHLAHRLLAQPTVLRQYHQGAGPTDWSRHRGYGSRAYQPASQPPTAHHASAVTPARPWHTHGLDNTCPDSDM